MQKAQTAVVADSDALGKAVDLEGWPRRAAIAHRTRWHGENSALGSGDASHVVLVETRVGLKIISIGHSVAASCGARPHTSSVTLTEAPVPMIEERSVMREGAQHL